MHGTINIKYIRKWTLRISLLLPVSGTELCIKMGLITTARGGVPQQCPSYHISNTQQSAALLFPGSDMLTTKTLIPVYGYGDKKS